MVQVLIIVLNTVIWPLHTYTHGTGNNYHVKYSDLTPAHVHVVQVIIIVLNTVI